MGAEWSGKRWVLGLSAFGFGCLFAASAAQAAEVTDLPPPLGAVAGVSWDGSRVAGGLVEGGTDIGERRVLRHGVLVGAEFAPVNGFALTVDLSVVPVYTFSYPAARTMVVDPVDGQGVYHQTDPGADVEVRANGLEGVWLGIAGAPFSELYASQQQITARLDFAVRTPRPKQNLWTASDGARGPAPGGWGLRFGAAFSTDRGPTNPYIRGSYNLELPLQVDVFDESGTNWVDDLQVRPASTAGADAGVELVAYEQEDGTRVAADVWVGAGYRSWEDVASGVYLPNVLDTGRLVPVTAGDTIFARGGLAADVHVLELLRMRAGATLGWAVPYRLEHLYAVQTTPNTLELGWFVELRGVVAAR